MTEGLETFRRVEKKYLLDERQYELLREKLIGRMETDRFGRHTIQNVYYDTPSYELIRRSLEKPIYKEKLRVRSYGEGDEAFLEIKKKFKGVVYKRRVATTQEEAFRFLDTGLCARPLTQIEREIQYFRAVYAPLQPAAFIAYEREALFSTLGDDLRLTFDRDIRFRGEEMRFARGTYGERVLPADTILLEMKIPGAMPLWAARILSELSIYPASYSKYGACYKRFLAPGLEGRQSA